MVGFGCMEHDAGNLQRAVKHFLLAAKCGYMESLEPIKLGYMDGYITKEEYEETLRAFHKSASDMKSKMRDEAAVALNE